MNFASAEFIAITKGISTFPCSVIFFFYSVETDKRIFDGSFLCDFESSTWSFSWLGRHLAQLLISSSIISL